jgi:hypothetical protein
VSDKILQASMAFRIRCSDSKAAEEFYVKGLGWPIIDRAYEHQQGMTFLRVLGTNQTEVELLLPNETRETEPFPPIGVWSIVFFVEDVEQERRRLVDLRPSKISEGVRYRDFLVNAPDHLEIIFRQRRMAGED